MSIAAARFLVIGALVVPLGLLAAGCGGAKPAPSVASLGTTSTGSESTPSDGAAGGASPQTSGGGGGGRLSITGPVQQLAKFAACIRRNGEPAFPDPDAQGQITTSIDPESAQFQKAQRACRKLQPNGGTPSAADQAKTRRATLAYSACMRSHGEPNFPDPQFGPGGRASLKISAGSGLDPRSAQFQAAQKACQKSLPGALSGIGTKTPGGGSNSG